MNCIEHLITPLWKGNTVYYESFLPRSNEVRLTYKIQTVIKVTNLAQTIEYQYGTDYTVKDGNLYIIDGSKIKIMDDDTYNPKTENNPFGPVNFKCTTGGVLAFGEKHLFHDLQYAITYTHNDQWTGPIPQDDHISVLKTKKRLSNKVDFTLGVIGDSISAGANASERMGVEPFQPAWSELLTQALEYYSGCHITYKNHSKGGMTSNWALETSYDFFKNCVPDLCIIEYGVNDFVCGMSETQFKENIIKIVDIFFKLNKDCEFILIPAPFTNPLAEEFKECHYSHEALYYELSNLIGNFCLTVPYTSIYQYLLTKKQFCDLTGNNINHPNDFLIRIMAQTVLGSLGII